MFGNVPPQTIICLDGIILLKHIRSLTLQAFGDLSLLLAFQIYRFKKFKYVFIFDILRVRGT